MVSSAGAIEFSGRADCGLEPTSTEPLSRTAQPLGSSISSSVVVLRPIIDTGKKSAAASLATVFADRNDSNLVIGGPEPAASISRRRFRQ